MKTLRQADTVSARGVVRDAIIQALADALVSSWRREHPESALHCRAS